jgi:hypothetical protein
MNNHEYPSESGPLRGEVRGVHAQLLNAGAVWRDQLPSSVALAERAAQLEAGRTSARGRTPHAGGDAAPRSPARSNDARAPRPAWRWRGWAAGAAAVLVAGMLGGLLLHAAPRRGTQPSATVTSTPPADWSFQPERGATYTTGMPMLAPSDPEVIYEAGPSMLRRSDDGGATWHDLPKPGTAFQGVVGVPFVVSPADPRTVFLTVDANGPCSGVSGSGRGGLCGATFVSTDGGAHWKQVALPSPGVLGSTAGLRSLLAVGGSLKTIQAQGHRLYSALGPYSGPDGDLLGVSSARLVTSTDGGLTWQYADKSLVGSMCDFIAAPGGDTIYALTSRGCGSEANPAISLWRSDDAGARWTSLGDLPSPLTSGGVAVFRVNGQALLYMNLPQLLSSGQTGTKTSDAASNLKVSADGGRTWIAAPTRGAPGGMSGPLAVLADGSVVMSRFETSADPGAPGISQLYAWKYGDAAWRKLSGLGIANMAYVLADPSVSRPALWVVYITPTGTQGVFQYNVKHVAV